MTAVRSARGCDVDGCDRQHSARGYCNLHYQRLRVYGDPLTTRPRVRKPCSIDGCDVASKGHGYCSKHLARVRKHGSPDVLAASGRPTVLEQPGWSGVHKRIHRARGSASRHACVDCGGRAQEWSYDNTDPNELIDAMRRIAYSLDIEHYEPRCIPCHRAFDTQHREEGTV